MFELLLNYGNNKPASKPLANRVWSSLAPFGASGLQSTGAVVDGKCYIFGGRVISNNAARNTAYSWDGTTMTPLANMPVALIGASCAAIGNKIYIFGGSFALVSGQENKTVYVYDISTNTYSTAGTATFNTIVGSAAAVGTDIYIYGGLANQTESGFPPVFYKYDTLSSTFTQLPYHNGSAVYTTTLLPFDDKLYVYGGEITAPGAKDQTMRVFDTVQGTWSLITAPATIPSQRSISACKIGEEGILIVGGRLPDMQVTNETWYYSLADNTWSKLANMVAATSFNVLLTIDDRIFTFDGYNGSSVTLNGIFEFK
jgi:N-acetylneuraminic acid mutarotase